MSAHTKVDVLAVIDSSIAALCTGCLCEIEESRELQKARDLVADLIVSGRRTIKAFETLGDSTGVIACFEARRECEDAMMALDEVIFGIGEAS